MAEAVSEDSGLSTSVMKTIHLEPSWKHNLSATELVESPPEGYQFTLDSGAQRTLFEVASKFDWVYALQHKVGTRVPLALAKSYLERLKRPPAGTDLTYATIHLVLRKEPWILDMQCEPPHLLLWTRWKREQPDRFSGRVRKALAAPNCKRIVCWVDAGRKALVSWLGEELEDKIEVIHLGSPSRDFTKSHDDSKITLLFVNSGNINTTDHFYRKGGSEVLEAFTELCRRYDNLELVIRSGVPDDVVEKYRHRSNVRIINQPIEWEELEREWLAADIFVLPSRVTPAKVFLEAMSYELPIVTTDVWGNPELVEDGKTGLLVDYPAASQYIHNWVPYYHAAYENTFRTPDRSLVQGLVEKLAVLIENPELRRAMGRAGRHELEQGKFSMARRNEKLRRIFDEATA